MPSLVQKVATNPAGNLAPLDSASESLGRSGVAPTSAGGDSPLLRTQRRSNAAIRARTVASQTLPTALQTAGASRRANGAIRAAASSELDPGRRVSEVESSRRQTEFRPLSSGEEARLNEILSEPMDYIDHPEYHIQGAEERIYGFAEIERPDVTWYRPLMDDFISARNRGTRSPKSQSSILLTGAQERILFMKYNYARFQVSEIQQKAAGRSLTLGEARTTLRWHAVAMQYREQLAETNLALVLAMAKRVRLAEVDFADLIGEGNMALMRSVDKFDCGRGFKFSTYACRAILKAFSRHGIKVTTQRKRFGAEYDPILEKSNHLETVRATHERECADEVKHILFSNKADLTQIERAVIGFRFGFNVDGSPLAIEAAPQNAAHASAPASIDDSLSRSATPTSVATNSTAGLGGAASPSPTNPPLTLEQVGQVVGLTKERVRQIQNKALEKIKLALHASNPDAASDMAVDIATREGRLPQKFAQSEN